MTTIEVPGRPAAATPGCPRQRFRADAGVPAVELAGPPDRPRLAEGVELLGEYAGTGYREPQHLARRPNGQLVQLSPLLHLVAAAADGHRDYAAMAAEVSGSFGKQVSADNVRVLVEQKLRPLGVLARADGSSPPVQPNDPLLGLKLRTQLIPPAIVRTLARLAHPLFWPVVVVAVVGSVLAVDGWLFLVHGLAQGLRSTVQQPAVFLLVFAVIVIATAFHELGHAAACSYGGGRPGGMGAGVYVVWPAFYTDVTDAYRLDRAGRLRTDLGGVYFNGIAVLVVAAAYAVTGYDPLILLCFLLQMLVLQQLLPLLRLDGYYVLADLVGVPDLFRRIGPVLRSALPWRRTEPEVAALKPWVRRVVTGWVLVLVPVLLLNLGYLLFAAPRVVATGWDSGMRLVGQWSAAGGLTDRSWITVQLLLLVVPFVGMTYTLSRVGVRLVVASWRWSAGSGRRRAGVLAGSAVGIGILAVAWWPDGRLQPYREGERGTLTQHVREVSHVGRGRPLLRSPEEAQTPLPAVPEGSSPVLAPAAAVPAGEQSSGAGSDAETSTGEGSGTSGNTSDGGSDGADQGSTSHDSTGHGDAEDGSGEGGTTEDGTGEETQPSASPQPSPSPASDASPESSPSPSPTAETSEP